MKSVFLLLGSVNSGSAGNSGSKHVFCVRSVCVCGSNRSVESGGKN